MKRILLVLTLSIFVVTLTKAQELPSYVPSEGLVAYYPFNGNANDASGNGNNGTVSGATLTVNKDGDAEKAYEFTVDENGGWGNPQQEITVDYSASMNSNTITLSAWVFPRTKPGSYADRPLTIFGRWADGVSNEVFRFQITYDQNTTESAGAGANKIFLQLSNASSNGNTVNDSEFFKGGEVPFNQWTHVAVTYDGSVGKVYQNGQLVAEEQIDVNVNAGGSALNIGSLKASNGTWYLFDGKLDELGYWNKVLSAEEIENLFSNSADILLNGTVSAENNQIKNVADPTDAQDAATKSYIDSLIANLQSQIDQINSTQPQYDLTEGLVGYYLFNGNANDASGNGNNGTVSGATLTANKDGDVNSAYSFDGDQDIITIPNNDQINTSQITISAMIRPTRYTALEQDQGDNQQVIVSNAPQDGWGSGFEFKTFGETDNNGNQYLSLGVTGTVNGNFSSQTDNIGMSLNQWSHVVYTHDDNNIKFYLNGQLVLSEDSPGTNFYNQNPISIGSRPSIRHVFSGGIDDVGIWNKILTAEEIEYLYSNPNFLE